MSNPLRPKTLRGAFVEYGFSIPPLIVVFQFNPEELTRRRSLTFAGEGDAVICEPPEGETEQSAQRRVTRRQTSLREFHNQDFKDKDNPTKNVDDLMAIQERQQVSVQEESISFDIRLDASDGLADSDPLAVSLGIAPRLATLELMTHPKADSLLGAAVDSLLKLDDEKGFSFAKNANPPMMLFIWGLANVLPVNIDSLSITETEFSRWLMPTRATVSVSLTVIEGKSIPYMYSKAVKEVTSLINLANITEVANVVVPG